VGKLRGSSSNKLDRTCRHPGLAGDFWSGCRDLNPGPLDPQSCRADFPGETVTDRSRRIVPLNCEYIELRSTGSDRHLPSVTRNAGRMVLKLVLKFGSHAKGTSSPLRRVAWCCELCVRIGTDEIPLTSQRNAVGGDAPETPGSLPRAGRSWPGSQPGDLLDEFQAVLDSDLARDPTLGPGPDPEGVKR